MTKLESIVLFGIQSVTADEWKGYCAHVEKLENEYWARNGIMEDTINEVIIHLNGSDDSSSSEDEFVSLADDTDNEVKAI
jgi:hypothetical protein